MKKYKLNNKPIPGTLIVNSGILKEGKDYIFNKKTNTIEFNSQQSKIREILEKLIEEDDKGRKRVNYDVGKTLDKTEKKILNLKLKEIIL